MKESLKNLINFQVSQILSKNREQKMQFLSNDRGKDANFIKRPPINTNFIKKTREKRRFHQRIAGKSANFFKESRKKY